MYYYESCRDDSEVIKLLEICAEKKPTRGFWNYYHRIRQEGHIVSSPFFGQVKNRQIHLISDNAQKVILPPAEAPLRAGVG